MNHSPLLFISCVALSLAASETNMRAQEPEASRRLSPADALLAQPYAPRSTRENAISDDALTPRYAPRSTREHARRMPTGDEMWTQPTAASPTADRMAPPGEALLARPSALFDEGEELDPIETDRDSFTPSTRTVGVNRLVVEAAYTFLNNRGVPETHSFPELLFRYGIADRIELRLGYNYDVGSGGTVISGLFGEGIDETAGINRTHTLVYGVKLRVFDQHFLMPESSVLIQGFTPYADEDLSDTQVMATYVFGWQFRNRWKWDSAIRYGTGNREQDHFNVWSPSTVLKIPIGDRFNIHAEYFGTFSDGRDTDFVQHFISPGIHFLVNPNLEVGVRLAWGLNDQSSRFAINTGLGWRY